MTPEQKLMALMAAHTPKKPDPDFEYEVLERVARLQAIWRFTRLAMAVVIGGGVLVALVLGVMQGDAARILPVVAAAVGASAMAALVVWTLRRAES